MFIYEYERRYTYDAHKCRHADYGNQDGLLFSTSTSTEPKPEPEPERGEQLRHVELESVFADLRMLTSLVSSELRSTAG